MHLIRAAGRLVLVGLALACSQTPSSQPPYPVALRADECHYTFSDSTHVYAEAEVDNPPRLVRPGPQLYPAEMRARGVAGWVRLHFVIDSAGAAVGPSIGVDAASDAAFISSAKDMLIASRFQPGSLQGRRVAVCVRQTINYALE